MSLHRPSEESTKGVDVVAHLDRNGFGSLRYVLLLLCTALLTSLYSRYSKRVVVDVLSI